MSELSLEALVLFSTGDPLIPVGLVIVALLIIPLGALHLFRIFCGFLELLLHEFKVELLAIWRILGRVKHELTTWRVDG